jgi:hypothetical protein
MSVTHGSARRQCSLKVEDVIRNLSELGITYAEAADILQQAGKLSCLNCALKVDTLPRATSIHELARDGEKGSDVVDAEKKASGTTFPTPESASKPAALPTIPLTDTP